MAPARAAWCWRWPACCRHAGGTVTLDGQNLTGASPDRIRRAGIAAVPEGHQVLTELTVAENLEVAAVTLPPGEAAAAMDSAYEVFPELKVLRPRAAGMLSGGQQQMLALAQALIARPTFILADEMSLGLAPVVAAPADGGGRAHRGGRASACC